MTLNPSFNFVEQLPDSHHLAAFATHSALFAVLDDYCCFHVTNQKQAQDYRKDLPHRLVFTFELDEKASAALPSPFFEYEFAVEIDPEQELWDQTATISHCTFRSCDGCDSETVIKGTFELTLFQFLNLYPALKDPKFANKRELLSFLKPAGVTEYSRTSVEEEEEEEVEVGV